MTSLSLLYANLLRAFLAISFSFAFLHSVAGVAEVEPAIQSLVIPADYSPSDTVDPVPLPPPAVRFERLLMDDGLSSSSVTSILQDNLGFIWIGTQGGLNKYDGHNIRVYLQDPDDPDSIRDNFIHSIYEDRDGTLWVGTQDGWLERYDRAADRFDHFKVGIHSLAMLEDSSGNFWVGTQDPGLVLFDPDSGKIETVWPGRIITAMAEDLSGRIWFGSREGGIARYERGQENYWENAEEQPVEDILVDDAGRIWIAAGDTGVGLYDERRDAFVYQSLSSGIPPDVTNAWVTSLHERKAGGFWTGSHGGLYQLNFSGSPETIVDLVSHHSHDPSDIHSLISNDVIDVYEDRAGVLWTANSFAGISKLPYGAGRFGHYRPGTDEANSPHNDAVTSIVEDQIGDLWLGGFSGLDRWDSRLGRWINYINDPQDPASLSDNTIRSVFADAENNIWVGTESGLDRFDRENDRFVRYQAPVVMWMLEDQVGTFWLATKEGIFQLDRESERLTLVREGWAWKIFLFEDSSGHIWVGTSGDGLEHFDPVTGEWVVYKHDPEDDASLGHHSVNAIAEDITGALWLATGDGLDRFEISEERFTHFRQKDGLPDGWVAGLLPDELGNLWISTGRGLSRFDPGTEAFRNYSPSDGVQDYYFWRNSQDASPSGMLYFGGVNGFNAFRPEDTIDNPQPPPVVITTLYVHDEVQQTDPPAGSTITLDYQDNFLSFDFATLDFNAPEMNQHAFMMEGLDSDWVQAGSRRHADYPDLKPGDYSFWVIGSNGDGVWNEEGVSVSIIIQPPFWQSWWFRGIILLGLAAIAYGTYRLRVRNLESRSRELEELVTSRTAELSEANLRLKQEMGARERVQDALSEEQAKAAVTAERQRLARDLHDSVTQSIYSLTLFAEATRHEADEKGNVAIERQAGQIGLIAQQALKEMRLLVYELRPPELEKEGLVRSLRRRIEAVERRAGIEGRVVTDDIGVISGEIEENLFRITQEALNNTLKHAAASSVTVKLQRQGDEIFLVVEDDGIGFDLATVDDQGGMGLQNIRDRSLEMGGSVDIHSKLGEGTRISVKVKLKSDNSDPNGGKTDE